MNDFKIFNPASNPSHHLSARAGELVDVEATLEPYKGHETKRIRFLSDNTTTVVYANELCAPIEMVYNDPEFQTVHSQFEECFTRHPLYDCAAIFEDTEDEDEEAFYGVYCSFNQYAQCFIVGAFHSLNDYEGKTVANLTTENAHEAARTFAKMMYCLHQEEYDMLPLCTITDKQERVEYVKRLYGVDDFMKQVAAFSHK